MLKQSLQQKLLQKLSPQQIQLMKLLQLPTTELEVRIKEELEANPALEEGAEKDWDENDLAPAEEQNEALDDFDFVRCDTLSHASLYVTFRNRPRPAAPRHAH